MYLVEEMREVPDCLNRRYQALDDLIQELSMVVSSRRGFDNESRKDLSDDPSIRLMCEFWDILKEDPDCNLTQAVKQRMGVSNTKSTVFGPRHVTCYMAGSGKRCGHGDKKCWHKENKESSTDPTMRESTSSHSCKKCAEKNKPKMMSCRCDNTPLLINDSEEDGVKESRQGLMIKEEIVKETPVQDIIKECLENFNTAPEITTKKHLTPSFKIYVPRDPIKNAKDSRESCKRFCNMDKIKSSARSVPIHNCGQGPPPKSDSTSLNRTPLSFRQTAPRVIQSSKDSKMKAKGSNESVICEKCSSKTMKRLADLSEPVHDCCQEAPPRTGSSPINRALSCLKRAASHGRQCNDKIQDLLQNQAQLKEQIQKLEQRETQGLQMIKKADCMWTCMEDAYKKKLEDSQQRQKELLKELKNVEENNNKYRKNNKDLEFQMNNLNKLQQEIKDKTNQKKNDIKAINTEIENLKKRVNNYSNETEANRKSVENRKNASNAHMLNLSAKMSKFEEELHEEIELKHKKEDEGTKYIKDARDDLQKICKVLLQKRLQNEDLRAEKKALEDEIDLLQQSLDQCKDKCSLKQKRMNDEIKKLTDEINNFKLKCLRCHQGTDTGDIRKLCADCPKCERERLCKDEGAYCTPDPSWDCVCQSVKQKFLDNVFENMYTVLARQSKTAPGKAVADVILKCLRKSTNGKLNKETRHILQDFILTTVKKNLNLTIVGGAVKTRCEMDQETYNQLMSCLKDVEAVKAPTEDKATDAKKASCRRWGGTNECNCPGGPKECICTKQAPLPLEEPGPNPHPDAEDPGEVVTCPHHKDKVSCGVDCAMHKGTNENPDWKRDPCKSPTSCMKFSTNMRAAQCVLGPESLMNMPTGHYRPIVVPFDKDMMKNKRGDKPKRQSGCGQDYSGRPRQRIIEEVLGKYREVTPIENVSKECKIKKQKRCLCSRLPIVHEKHLCEYNCRSDWIVIDGIDALKQKLLQTKNTHICQTIKRDSPTISKVKSRAKEFKGLLLPKSGKIDKGMVIDHSKTKYAKDLMTEMIVSDKNRAEYVDDSRVHAKEFKVLFHPKSDEIQNGKSKITNTNHSNAKYHTAQISKIAKDLMTDVLVSDKNREEYVDDTGIKWMTIDAFIKQLSSAHNSLAGDRESDDEIEMDCKALNGRLLC